MAAARSGPRRYAVAFAAGLLLVPLVLAPPARAAGDDGTAPGAPGERATWTPADKQGFGTARPTAGKLWFTLGAGELTEVYHPRLDTPSVRDLELAVSDG
jgi:glucoamylase